MFPGNGPALVLSESKINVRQYFQKRKKVAVWSE